MLNYVKTQPLINTPYIPLSGNASLRKQLHNEERGRAVKITKGSEDGYSQGTEQKINQSDVGSLANLVGSKLSVEELPSVYDFDNSTHNQGGNLSSDNDDLFPENCGKSAAQSTSSSVYQFYEAKVAALIRKTGVLEGQLGAALAGREAAEKNLSAALKSRLEMEKKLSETVKEVELLREKLAGVELAQEEVNNLSNIVHSDNVRLEHDVAFLKAVLDDTHSAAYSNNVCVRAKIDLSIGNKS